MNQVLVWMGLQINISFNIVERTFLVLNNTGLRFPSSYMSNGNHLPTTKTLPFLNINSPLVQYIFYPVHAGVIVNVLYVGSSHLKGLCHSC